MSGYPIIMNGDHAEFEREHAHTPPKERPDWPLPSFDARDWAEAFCKIAERHGFRDAEGQPIDEGWMISWFANALMRGFDEHSARFRPQYEALMAAGHQMLADPYYTIAIMNNDCACPSCQRRRAVVTALRAAGIQIEGEPD